MTFHMEMSGSRLKNLREVKRSQLRNGRVAETWGGRCLLCGPPFFGLILWMDEILHRFETMGNHCLLAFTRQASLQHFLGGARFSPSTVWPWLSKPMGSHLGVGAPPILEPILVGIGMFTGGEGLGCSLGVREFDPWPYYTQLMFLPFDLSVFPSWSMLSQGPKWGNLYLWWVFWATEYKDSPPPPEFLNLIFLKNVFFWWQPSYDTCGKTVLAANGHIWTLGCPLGKGHH